MKIPEAEAERWEDVIEREYQARLRLYPDQALEWRLIYSPRRVLSGARVAFIGLNPGGRFVDPAHGKFSCEAGSAYRKEVENWLPSSALQDQVLALFERLGVAPEDVLAGNLVPFRSPSEKSLAGTSDAIAFGRNLWSEILRKISPEVVVTMGSTANHEVSNLLGVRQVEAYATGWGSQTASRGSFPGGTWIGLPHLSRFTIMKRSASQSALNVLFEGLSTENRKSKVLCSLSNPGQSVVGSTAGSVSERREFTMTPRDIVQSLEYLDREGMSAAQVCEMHHFGKHQSHASLIQYFGRTSKIGSDTNLRFGERLAYVVREHKAGRRDSFAPLISEACKEWPLSR